MYRARTKEWFLALLYTVGSCGLWPLRLNGAQLRDVGTYRRDAPNQSLDAGQRVARASRIPHELTTCSD
jgi:hypothetical protein